MVLSRRCLAFIAVMTLLVLVSAAYGWTISP